MTQSVKSSTEDKQAVLIKDAKYHDARSTDCNRNTKENKSTGWNHKDFMKVTFRLRYKVSQVCQILQTAHSMPIPTYVDSTATSLVK